MKKNILTFNEHVVFNEELNTKQKEIAIDDFSIINIGTKFENIEAVKEYTIKKLKADINSLSPAQDYTLHSNTVVRLGRITYIKNSTKVYPIIQQTNNGDEFVVVYNNGVFDSVKLITHTMNDTEVAENIKKANRLDLMLKGASKDDIRMSNKRYIVNTVNKENIIDIDSGLFKLYVDSEKNKFVPKVAFNNTVTKGMSFEAGREFSYYAFDKTQNKKVAKTAVVSDYTFDDEARILYILTDDKRRVKITKDTTMIISPKTVSPGDIAKMEELVDDISVLREIDFSNVKFIGKVFDVAVRKSKYKSKYSGGDKHIPQIRIKASSIEY